MALRKIRQYDDVILRKKSKTVLVIDKRTEELIEDMLETMYNADGVGLAAPQVGILKRIVVIDVGEGPIILINPEILASEGESIMQEGCLSVPGVLGDVKRPEKITVEAQDVDGNKVRIEGDGLLARALFHEIDHLNGILFIDKAMRIVDSDIEEGD
ncbi:MAG TPA: peptide deformylase [Thermoanaerobacterales bacterium]|nr:peptide deformylase [Thermoanaerobacterales bacterium]